MLDPTIPLPTAPPAALIQAASNKVVALADAPPGSTEAKSLTSDVLALLLQLGQSLQASGILPEAWQKILAGVIAALTLVIASGIVGRLTAPTSDPANTAITAKLDAILVKLGAPVDPVKPPDVKPVVPVVVPPVEVKRYVYMLTLSTDASITKGLPPGIVERYRDGTTYADVLMPVVVVRDAAGKDLEVKALK